MSDKEKEQDELFELFNTYIVADILERLYYFYSRVEEEGIVYDRETLTKFAKVEHSIDKSFYDKVNLFPEELAEFVMRVN